jgi:hypothetical protein
LCSPNVETSYYTKGVNADGEIDNNRAYDDTIGVRPAIQMVNLKPQQLVAGDGSFAQPFQIDIERR